MIEGLQLATAAARFADDKQAEEIRVLDVRGLSTITDFLVICTGTSNPHLKAIRREIADRTVSDHEVKATATDGTHDSQWMVLDYGDVMVHVFHKDKRDFYSLEDLWSDAPQAEWEAETQAST